MTHTYCIIMFFILFVAGFFAGKIREKYIYDNKFKELSKVLEDTVKGDVVNFDSLKEGVLGIIYSQLEILNYRIRYSNQRLLDEKIKMKEYIADISHQLKTPLTGMLTYHELLLNSETKSCNKTMLKKCVFLSEKMNNLLKNLLDIARLEVDEISFLYENHNISNTIKRLVEDVNLCNWGKDVRIILKENDCDVYCRYDEYWLLQGLFNIVKNGIFYGGNPPIIKITIEDLDVFIRISIEDNGEGIKDEDRANIFRRFYRANNKNDGYGIGLAVAKIITEKHHGSLYLSQIPEGTKFVMELPRNLCVNKVENI